MKRFALSSVAMIATLAWMSGSVWAQDKDHKHDHPTKGPHKGSLVELGDEEYHAEVVHDDKEETVTIYILDSKAKEAVPIEAKEIAINVKSKEKPKQFKLKADPQKSDGENMSSKFVLKDKDLCEALDSHSAECRLRLTIKGKSFNAKIEHDHDHDHDHKDKK